MSRAIDAMLTLILFIGVVASCVNFCHAVRHVDAYPLVAKCDQDDNSVLNSADLAAIAQGWGTTSGDVNLDGTTNSADLAGCARAFNVWAYPEGPNPDDSIELPTVTTEGLSLEEQATATALAGICPECVPAATAPVPTP